MFLKLFSFIYAHIYDKEHAWFLSGLVLDNSNQHQSQSKRERSEKNRKGLKRSGERDFPFCFLILQPRVHNDEDEQLMIQVTNTHNRIASVFNNI